MLNFLNAKQNLFFLLPLLLLTACLNESNLNQKEVIVIREMADATTLNPVFSGGELSGIVGMQLYQTLIGIDYRSNELVGILAKSAPSQEVDSNGRLNLTFELREEATFDDGTPILAEDVLFSIKLNLCPAYQQMGGAAYYNFIEAFEIDNTNPRKFTIICEDAATRNKFAAGDFAVLPRKNYDPNNVLESFSIDDLKTIEQSKNNEKLAEFATQFEANQFAFEPNFISGSGPYKLSKWEKGQFILLEKKNNWWGESIEENIFFDARAPKIRYEIINDPVTALTALKSGKIDFMRNIPASDFSKLESNKQLTTLSKEIFGYQYIGFNLNQPLLQSTSLRQAVAYAIPTEKIIEVVFYGQAVPTYGPFSPIQKEFDSNFKNKYQYNLEKSKQLLKIDQWKDFDGDGILEKGIKDDTLSLSLKYHYNAGNEQRKAVGLIMQSEFKKIGIELEVLALEWSVYLQGLRNGEFDLFYGGVVSMPVSSDFNSLFHSELANGGRNYANYQSAVTDSLIQLINNEKNQNKSKDLINAFSENIQEDLPYFFLLTPKENIAYSNALKNVSIYSIRPNYWAPEISWK